MVDINHADIKLMASQRLDDTDEGGGQMTATEVVDGAVNNLFPDISRFDRVYGRVSMRKAFLAVQTANRATYYGSHAVITEQAADPNVGVTFFSSEDWFDTREDAKNRIESYLVKGPQQQAALWGTHYVGSRAVSFFQDETTPVPSIGDVIVLVKDAGLSTELSQFVRLTDVTQETRTFTYMYGSTAVSYRKNVVTASFGESLIADFPGSEAFPGSTYKNSGTYPIGTMIYTTVAADASRYYGIATLADAAESGDLSVRVDSIFTPLVPSAQSETAIVDAGLGTAVSPITQTQAAGAQVTITRSIAFTFGPNAQLFLGEGILPGTFSWSGGTALTDDGKGGIYAGSTEVGSIAYDTGVITFGGSMSSWSGTGTATYVPACAPVETSESGAIGIEAANRGFVYTYSCNPLPVPGTLRIDYLAGGKWYTLRDLGNGEVKGSDPALGSASVNFTTGSVSISLGAMPDIGSLILLFWGRSVLYSDVSGDTLAIKYPFSLNHQGINQGSLVITWVGDGNGPGPDGRYGVIDDGEGKMVAANYSGGAWVETATEVGWVRYAAGEGEFGIGATQYVPLSSELFSISYAYGAKLTESFTGLTRDPDTTITLTIAGAPVVPGSVRITWKNQWSEWDPAIQQVRFSDPSGYYEYKYYGYSAINEQTGEVTMVVEDDGLGNLKIGSTTVGTIVYATGVCNFQPDKIVPLPIIQYDWTSTTWEKE